MRFLELNENRYENPSTVKAREIFTRIKQDCEPFFKMNISKNPLYRGINTNSNKDVFIKEVRKDRTPSNVDKKFTEAFDEVTAPILNTQVRRTNSIFTTGNHSMALEFGELFVIFPIGEFEFVWSSEINDYFDLQSDYKTNRNIDLEPFRNIDSEKYKQKFEDELNLKIKLAKNKVRNSVYMEIFRKWQNHLQEKAIEWLNNNPESKYTISQIVDKWLDYYASEIDVETEEAVNERIKNNMVSLENSAKKAAIREASTLNKEKFGEYLAKKYQTDDLDAAIASGNEIMIHCDKYYAVTDMYYDVFLRGLW